MPVDDPARDIPQRGLDISRAVFSNRDLPVVSRLRFTEDRPGTVIVKVGARHRLAVYIISEHRRTGPDNTFLEGGARCRGLSSSWDRDIALPRLRLPARCLDDGNYGAVHHWALTEARDGGDIWAAPQDAEGKLSVTDWISRG